MPRVEGCTTQMQRQRQVEVQWFQALSTHVHGFDSYICEALQRRSRGVSVRILATVVFPPRAEGRHIIELRESLSTVGIIARSHLPFAVRLLISNSPFLPTIRSLTLARSRHPSPPNPNLLGSAGVKRQIHHRRKAERVAETLGGVGRELVDGVRVVG